MSVVLDRPTPAAAVESVRVLALLEARRFARHPFFLIGVGLCAIALFFVSSDGGDRLSDGFFVSFFIGVFSMVAAYRLTRSTDRSSEAVRAAPTSELRRTAALCLACLVPAAAGVAAALGILLYSRVNPAPEYVFGVFGTSDRVFYYLGQTVIASLGGPLLGVAAGRWLRFPGAAALLVVAVMGEVIAMLAIADIVGDEHPLLASAASRFTPFTWFHTVDVEHDNISTVASVPGSPAWYAAWLVALCVLAACAAMLRGARGLARQRLLRTFWATLAIAVVLYALTITGGLNEIVYTPVPEPAP